METTFKFQYPSRVLKTSRLSDTIIIELIKDFGVRESIDVELNISEANKVIEALQKLIE